MADATLTVIENRAVLQPFGSDLLTPYVERAENAASEAALSAAEAEISADAVSSVSGLVTSEQLSLVDMGATSINLSNLSNVGFPDLVRPFARRLTRVKTTRDGSFSLQVSVAGSTPSTATKLIDPVVATVVANQWSELSPAIIVPADAVVWVRLILGGLKYVAGTIPDGGVQWNAGTNAIETDTAYTTSTTNGYQIEFEFDGEVLAGAEDGSLAFSAVGISGEIGRAAPIVNTGSTLPATYTTILPLSGEWTHVTGIEIGQAASGTGTLFVVTMDGTEVDTVHSQVSVTVPAGVNTIPLAALIPLGATVAWQSAGRFQNSAGGGGSLYVNKALEPGDVGITNPHRCEFRIFVASGLTGRVGVLESLVDAGNLPLYVVADGNSLTQGSGGATPWPTLLAAELGITIVNKGVGGQTTTSMISDFATDIAPLATQIGKRTVYIIDGEPYNRMRAGATATQGVNDVETLANLARAAGFDYVFVTNAGSHNTNNGLDTEGQWNRLTSKATLNAEFAARWLDFADGLIDIGSAPALSNYSNLIYYQADGIHYTTAGQQIVSNRIRAAMNMIK